MEYFTFVMRQGINYNLTVNYFYKYQLRKNIMKQKILLIILVATLFQRCSVTGTGAYKNNHIEKDKREEIKVLNDKLINGIINNDVSAIKSLMSDKLLEASRKNIDSIISQIHLLFK